MIHLASSIQSRNVVILKAGCLCLYITGDHKIKVEMGTSCRDCSVTMVQKLRVCNLGKCSDFPLLNQIRTDTGVEIKKHRGLFLPAAGRGSVEMYLHRPSIYLHVVVLN